MTALLVAYRQHQSSEDLATEVAERRGVISETAHILNGLAGSIESRALQGKLREIDEGLQGVSSFEHLSALSSALQSVRARTRGACRRAAAMGVCNWQSPTMEHSLDCAVRDESAALLQRGIDYHRAAHLVGQEYEALFREKLLAQHADARVLATSSGMGAIFVALQFVSSQIVDSGGAVVVDQGCYHETRFLLEALFRNRLQYLDLASARAVEDLAHLKPALVVFDATRNSRSIARLPVCDIMAAVREAGSFLVIDSTSMVSASPILSAAKANGLFDRVLVAHSLAKLHQYGMDLVTGGALVYSAALDSGFPAPGTFRTHLGLNITEDSAATLPAPSLELLSNRAATISRNVQLLASAFAEFRESLSVGVAPSWDCDVPLVPYCNLCLVGQDESDWYRAFIGRAMDRARARGVPLVAGTSFGFDTTRIYLVESLIPSHRPFIRISPGVETLHEMTLLAGALTEAVGEMR